MLSYYIIDLGYAAILFFIMTILLSYKRSRKTLPVAYLFSVLLYVVLDFICLSEIPGISMSIRFVLAGFFEMFATFLMLCFFTSGNIWRNYSMLIFAFVCANALSSSLVTFNTRLEKVFAGYLVNGYVPIKIGVILALLMCLCGLIVVPIMSKFIKKDYKGNGRLYLIFSLVYVLIGSVQVVYRQNTIKDGLEENGGVGIPKFVYILAAITTFYVFGLLYYRYEGIRLNKENEKLKEYIRGNDERYQKLVADNSKMSQVKSDFMDFSRTIDGNGQERYKEELQLLAGEIDSVTMTGNIVIDALINNSYKQAKSEGIRYELIPGNVSFAEDKIISFATIIENLLILANEYAKTSERKWAYLAFRQNGDMVLIKTEFSKNKRNKLAIDNNVFAKQTKELQRVKLIKSLAEAMCGTTSITNEDEEACISILVNNRLGD